MGLVALMWPLNHMDASGSPGVPRAILSLWGYCLHAPATVPLYYSLLFCIVNALDQISAVEVETLTCALLSLMDHHTLFPCKNVWKPGSGEMGNFFLLPIFERFSVNGEDDCVFCWYDRLYITIPCSFRCLGGVKKDGHGKKNRLTKIQKQTKLIYANGYVPTRSFLVIPFREKCKPCT